MTSEYPENAPVKEIAKTDQGQERCCGQCAWFYVPADGCVRGFGKPSGYCTIDGPKLFALSDGSMLKFPPMGPWEGCARFEFMETNSNADAP